MALPQPQSADPLRDALAEFAEAATALAETGRRYLDAGKEPERPRMQVVRNDR